jgi:hypothetical protein
VVLGNASAEVRQTTTYKEALLRIAASLEQVAAALVSAQRHGDAALGDADGALEEIGWAVTVRATSRRLD